MRKHLLDALERVLLSDGAMGTRLMESGLVAGQSGDAWNLDHPEKVRAIHQSYVDAGADTLITNSFQGSPLALARHGLADRAYELNLAAAAQVA